MLYKTLLGAAMILDIIVICMCVRLGMECRKTISEYEKRKAG